MENLNNIVEQLTSQHRNLQKDLGKTWDLSKEENPNMTEIDVSLRQFTTDLQDHLHLENDIFYSELLKRMKNKGVDTVKTEDFIAQMSKIGVVVMGFLTKFKDTESIKSQFNDLKNELGDIISALNLRIESEESGVYGYWSIYQ